MAETKSEMKFRDNFKCFSWVLNFISSAVIENGGIKKIKSNHFSHKNGLTSNYSKSD